MFGLFGGASILQGAISKMSQSAVKMADFSANKYEDDVNNSMAYSRLDQAMQGASKLLEKSKEQANALMKSC
jgi:hypothetical protein